MTDLGGERPPVSNTGAYKFAESGARLLAFAFDTVYWFVRLEDGALGDWWAGVARDGVPAFAEVQSGNNGYKSCLWLQPGLRVQVAQAERDDMGLYVMAGPEFLRGHDLGAWEKVIAGYLSSLGFCCATLSMRVSRFDLAADLLCPGGFVDESEIGYLVSRGRRRHFYRDGESFTGLSVGRGDIRFRLYDKVRESGAKLDYWLRVWGIDRSVLGAGFGVARAEWQVRGDAVRDWGITGVESINAILGDLVRYLAGSWVRFAEAGGGHDHERAPREWWAFLVASVRERGLSVAGVIRGVVGKLPRLDVLRCQVVGLLASASAVIGVRSGMDGPEEYGATLRTLLKPLWYEENRGRWEAYAERAWRRARLSAVV